MYVDSRSPLDRRTLYVVAAASVSVRKAGQWKQGASPGVASFRDASAGFLTGGDLIVYGVGARQSGTREVDSIVISRDGGATWNAADGTFAAGSGQPATDADLEAVATSLNHPEVAYVSYEGRSDAVNAGSHGVVKTADSGRTWESVWKEVGTPASNVHDAWVTGRFGTGWGEPGISLGVSPNDPKIAYRTDDGRTMRTRDGGLTEDAVYSKRLPDHTYATTGLDVTTNYGVFFDPFDPKRMFIAYTDIGLFGSENRGRSCSGATVAVPRRWVNTTYWITFDPAVKGRVWGVMSYIHDLPRPKMWRRTSPSTYAGGVCVSDDGGRTWRTSNDGMPPTAATHILLDPTSPPSARVLYVAGFGRGVFKSSDGGKTWTLKNNGLPGPEPFGWRLARDKNGVLYLVIARRSEDGSYGNAPDGALYRSTDGAEHWQRIALPEGVNGPNGVAIDPGDPKRLYLAAWGRQTPDGAVAGGIFVSADAGQAWKNVLDRDQHVYDVTIDPRDPRILCACGFESSA